MGRRAPHGDRDPLPGAAHDLDRVAVRVLDDGVAVGDRDAADVELGRRQREPESQTVVDAGIGVDDDGKGHA